MKILTEMHGSQPLFLAISLFIFSFMPFGWLGAEDRIPSDAELVSLLKTGESSAESLVYWHCVVGEQRSDVHLRLWAEGVGFSGKQDIQWQVLGAQRVSITYSNGTFELDQIVFGDERYAADSFVAIDSSGSFANCQRIGPLRGGEVLNDNNESLLESQLILEENKYWSCNLTGESGALKYLSLEFNVGAAGFKGSTPTRWFVDEQYNVVISELSADTIVREPILSRADFVATNTTPLYTGNDPDIMVGKVGDEELYCEVN